jgi:hypothetical protein
MQQTVRSGRARSPLILRGDLINAGSFSDIVHDHAAEVAVTLGFRLHTWGSKTAKRQLGGNPPAACEVSFETGTSPGIINLRQYAVNDSFDRSLLIRTRRSNRYSLEKIRAWAPGDDDEKAESAKSVTDKAARKAINASYPNHFLFSADRITSAAIEAATRRVRKRSSGDTRDSEKAADEEESIRDTKEVFLSRFSASYCSVVAFVEEHIEVFLRNVIYLGPIREKPKRLYEVSGDAPRDVGVRGQFTPEVLLRASKGELFEQVNAWLKRFGLPGRLYCNRLTETAFSLEFMADSGSLEPESVDETDNPAAVRTNFADVGFGYSQILPLIVQGLVSASSSGEDRLLIAEQPEIHLNPKMQSGLADFFAEITGQGVTVLTETHSEHLLLGVRRLIAEGKIQADDVAIYYVEAGSEGSVLREVPVQSNGHIEAEDWPKGFFEDALRESFALAMAQAGMGDSAK